VDVGARQSMQMDITLTEPTQAGHSYVLASVDGDYIPAGYAHTTIYAGEAARGDELDRDKQTDSEYSLTAPFQPFSLLA